MTIFQGHSKQHQQSAENNVKPVGALTERLFGKVRFLGPAFIASSLALHTINTLQLANLNVRVGGIADRPQPTLVQTGTGETFYAKLEDHHYRTPAVIRKFVGDTLSLQFNWYGVLPPEAGDKPGKTVADPGVEVDLGSGRRGKVTTAAYYAAFAFREGFRQTHLTQLAEMTPAEIFSRQWIAAFEVQQIGTPRPDGPGRWRVEVNANLRFYNPTTKAIVGSLIPFNKTLYLKAVDTPAAPTGSNTLQQVVAQIRGAGLEIYQIFDTRE